MTEAQRTLRRPTDPLAEGTVIAFRAVKAQTGVAVNLAKTVTVTAPAAG